MAHCHGGGRLKVFVVDNSAPVRERLVELLATADGLEVVGEASEAPSAIAAIEAVRPDAVVLDLGIPGGGGLVVLKAIKSLRPAPLVIVLTNYTADEYRRESLVLGADHFLDKSTEFGGVPGLLTLNPKRANHGRAVPGA